MNTHHRIEQFDQSFIQGINNDSRYVNGVEVSIDAYGNHPINNRRLSFQSDTQSNGYEHGHSNLNNVTLGYQDRLSNESISHSTNYNNQGNVPSLNTYTYPQGHAENHFNSQGQNYYENNFAADSQHQNDNFQGNGSYPDDMKSKKYYHISSNNLSEKDRSYENKFSSITIENNQEMNKMTGQTSIIGEELNTSKNFNCSIAGNIKDTNEEFEEATKKKNYLRR